MWQCHILTSQQADADASGSFAYAPSMIANRVSFHLDLRGPSVPVDTACSSSLYATHLAVQALHNGECDAAVVGGCQINHRCDSVYSSRIDLTDRLSPLKVCGLVVIYARRDTVPRWQMQAVRSHCERVSDMRIDRARRLSTSDADSAEVRGLLSSP